MHAQSEHFLSTSELTHEKVRNYLDLAKKFSKADQKKSVPAFLKGKTVVNLFFENSTRTRMSFELATRKLAGTIANFQASTSSLQKGETLIDTAKSIQALEADCLVVRHSSAGSPQILSKVLNIPIVNAGDGFHEHPTQGLLDVYTMEERLGSLKDKRVVICGDIAHSRVARSNIHLLKMLGAHVSVSGPPTLIPPQVETLGVEYRPQLEDLLKDADVLMTLRVQMERQNRMQIPSLSEYAKFWGVNKERSQLMKKDSIIMHPGPLNRGVEIDPEVADGPRSVILDQVSNGVYVRMAVLASLCNSEEVSQWKTP